MRKLFITTLTLFFCLAIFAQENNQVLLTIDGKEITRSEFERIYTKNNQDPAFDRESLEEYMDLFINFKLKVIEAEAQGLDTLKTFITELQGYRRQLEKPYFTDSDVDEALMKEAYERMKWDVRASHILILVDKNASPKDTLKAYNKIKEIRQKAINGTDFNKLAVQYSEDRSVQRNQGDLGYFTAFSMVYPFEEAAYNTPVGEVSEIIRTRFGYHILNVVDKKKDVGEIKVAHLMRAVPQGSSKEKAQLEKEKIHAIYDSIMAGANFTEMVKKHSDDRGSSQRGGELQYFGTGRMVPEFEKAAFAIDGIGNYSEPIQTAYGWHIIKLLDVKPLGEYDEVKPKIKQKISKDVRAQRGREKVMATLKKEYNLTINKDAIPPFYEVIDSTIYKGEWDGQEKAADLNDVLFTLADSMVFTQADFAKHISNDNLRRINKPIQLIVDEEIERYIEKELVKFERDRLEEKYPEFRHLMQEYHDGILLFNLTDKMVWSKAVEDTTGLEAFYEENKNNYLWGDRVEATIYKFNKEEWGKKIAKLAKKTGKKEKNVDVAKREFLEKAAKKDTLLTLTVTKSKYSKGDNNIIDGVAWESGLHEVKKIENDYVIVYIDKVLGPEPKLLNEAKGIITADYQTYLEKQWLEKLREKYTIEINQEVFEGMVE